MLHSLVEADFVDENSVYASKMHFQTSADVQVSEPFQASYTRAFSSEDEFSVVNYTQGLQFRNKRVSIRNWVPSSFFGRRVPPLVEPGSVIRPRILPAKAQANLANSWARPPFLRLLNYAPHAFFWPALLDPGLPVPRVARPTYQCLFSASVEPIWISLRSRRRRLVEPLVLCVASKRRPQHLPSHRSR